MPSRPASANSSANSSAKLTTSLTGAAGEELAAKFLQKNGLRIIERNFRVKGGEIDLICGDGDAVVFVEVRVRSSDDFGGAAASITPTKQRRLVLAASQWLQRYGEHPCRFDAVLINGSAHDRITWLRAAFSAD